MAARILSITEAHRNTRTQVALDGEIIYGEALVSTEHITGEALPARRRRGDEVPAGALNHDGVLVVRASRSAAHSTPARIARLTQYAQVRCIAARAAFAVPFCIDQAFVKP